MLRCLIKKVFLERYEYFFGIILILLLEFNFRRDYQRAMHLNPTYLPARVNLAYTQQVAGKFFKAWHQFTAAIAIDPSKPSL